MFTHKPIGSFALRVVWVPAALVALAGVTVAGARHPIGAAVSTPAGAVTLVTTHGRQLLVNGLPFLMRGVGYAPTPIGDDPDYSPAHGDYFTSNYAALYNRDLPLLRQMGANTVRLWGWQDDGDHGEFLGAAYNGGVAPIYVIASYWIPGGLDLSAPAVRDQLTSEFVTMVTVHKDNPAVLMWAIGNELNATWMYGNADDLFSLADEMAQAAHEAEDANYHPVTMPLADQNMIATICQRDPQVPHLDVWSVQVYRGDSFGTLFDDYAACSARPLVITEFGIDAYDDRYGDEYELIGPPQQAVYAEKLWNEIVAHDDTCSGGAIMEYSDEWWKGKYDTYGHPGCPDSDPWFHGACGYPSGAHPDGYANEEWWGVMRTVDNGANPDVMQPRAVYYALQSLWLSHWVYLPAVMR